VLTVGNDAVGVEQMLEEGSLCCPLCGGRLARWGHARGRTVFLRGQVGQDLKTGKSVGIGDAAAQADHHAQYQDASGRSRRGPGAHLQGREHGRRTLEGRVSGGDLSSRALLDPSGWSKSTPPQ